MFRSVVLAHCGARRFATVATLLLAAVFLLTALAVPGTVDAKKYTYPEAKKGNVADDFHGTMVKDPYRWLEDPEAEATLKWVTAENKLTQAFIKAEPSREAIEKRLTELWNYPKYSLPTKKGDRYFFTKNDGLQNQSVLYMQESLEGKATVVLDPNELSEDGTAALRVQTYSSDGKFLVYGVTQGGSDWQEIKIRNVDTGKDYPEALEWCKFTGIAWKKDNSGFFYNRLPEPGSVPEEDQNNFVRVYWHQLGTPQSEDKLVYGHPSRTLNVATDLRALVTIGFCPAISPIFSIALSTIFRSSRASPTPIFNVILVIRGTSMTFINLSSSLSCDTTFVR